MQQIYVLLRSYGADMNKESNGKTVLEWARKLGVSDLFESLDNHDITLDSFKAWLPSLIRKPVDDEVLKNMFSAWKKTAE